MDIRHCDLIEIENDGFFHQVEILDDFTVSGEQVIDKPTLVYDYEDCPDSWFSYVYEVKDVLDKITAVYRKIDGELKLIYKKGE